MQCVTDKPKFERIAIPDRDRLWAGSWLHNLHSTAGTKVHFLLPGFPATPPRNHNRPQLGGSTPTDGAVKGLLRLGYIGPHGGLAGA